MLSHKGCAESQNGELGPPIPLFGILILSAFLTILGTSIPNPASFTSPTWKGADTGNRGGFTSRPDRSSEKANEGSLLAPSADHFFFLPEIRRATGFVSAVENSIARQLPRELHTNYFRPPPVV